MYSRPLTSPGTPAASPPNMLFFGFFLNIFWDAAAGAVSLKSITSYVPFPSLTTAKPPPPIPEWYMPTTPTQNCVPTRASTAFPCEKSVRITEHSGYYTNAFRDETSAYSAALDAFTGHGAEIVPLA